VGIAEGGIRETIQDGVNGFLVNPEPESLARAAQSLLHDLGLAKRLGETAADYVQAGVGRRGERFSAGDDPPSSGLG
jgi:glycosyltransferase involved in cell wall biosynthesis